MKYLLLLLSFNLYADPIVSYVGTAGDISVLHYRQESVMCKVGDKFPGTEEVIIEANKNKITTSKKIRFLDAVPEWIWMKNDGRDTTEAEPEPATNATPSRYLASYAIINAAREEINDELGKCFLYNGVVNIYLGLDIGSIGNTGKVEPYYCFKQYRSVIEETHTSCGFYVPYHVNGVEVSCPKDDHLEISPAKYQIGDCIKKKDYHRLYQIVSVNHFSSETQYNYRDLTNNDLWQSDRSDDFEGKTNIVGCPY